MRKLILLLICLFAVQTKLYAFDFLDFDKLYTVKSYGDTTEYHDFSWDEKPYLYLKVLPVTLSDSFYTKIFTLWKNPDSDLLFTYSNTAQDPAVNQGVNEYWLQSDDWDGNLLGTPYKVAGAWDTTTFLSIYSVADGSFTGLASGKYSFNLKPLVTPEPMSAALFLFGGMMFLGFKTFTGPGPKQ